MQSRRFLHRRRLVAACVGLMLIGAACGATPATTTDPAASPSSAPSGESGESAALTVDGAPTSTLLGSTGPDGFGVTPCPPATGTAAPVRSFTAPFARCIDPSKTYTATIITNKGVVTAILQPSTAPIATNNFVALARSRFYDGLTCHRIVPDFITQCGDPTGTGTGGPGYRIVDELPPSDSYQIGTLAMANRGPNTSGSQFFVVTGLDGVGLTRDYTIFGQATGSDAAIQALNALGNPDDDGVPPRETVTITSVVVIES